LSQFQCSIVLQMSSNLLWCGSSTWTMLAKGCGQLYSCTLIGKIVENLQYCYSDSTTESLPENTIICRVPGTLPYPVSRQRSDLPCAGQNDTRQNSGTRQRALSVCIWVPLWIFQFHTSIIQSTWSLHRKQRNYRSRVRLIFLAVWIGH